jgi:8-oxo-dGTP pyrophosphatase MutT (NUDIX family)
MLLRQGAETIEVYLTRRHSRSRFMPDAFVFPGGAVDAADSALGRTRVRGRAGTAEPTLVVAAVRETFEEAGILLASDARGLPAHVDPHVLATGRSAIHAGSAFGTFLHEHDLTIDADRLAYYSNWITPDTEPIRFDAHFFVALAPPDQIAAADAMEVHDGVWLSANAALAQADAGEMTIRFPTRKHLERLAAYSNVDDFFAAARTRIVTPVRPTETSDGVFDFDEDAW